MVAACDATSTEHADAVALVEYLMEQKDSASTVPQMEIARKLDMVTRHGSSLEIDTRRFYRARNHLHDRVDVYERPCCGFRVHYRGSGPASTLVLIDPSGDLGSHVRAVVASIAGYISRKRQHDTEDSRMVESFRALADHCLSRGDMTGAKLMLRSQSEIERDNTISPQTMSDIEAWLATT